MIKKTIITILFRNPWFITCFRIYHCIITRKRNRYLDSIDKNFKMIYNENKWGNSESKSGGGSTISATTTLRHFLPIFFQKYNIKTILDIPCGDYNWMKMVEKKNIEYIGADIVDELIDKNNRLYRKNNVSFRVLDLTKDKLPQVDLIICKDCLQHLSYTDIWKSLNNIKKSSSKYLLTTSYPLTLINHNITNGDYRALNLRKVPFSLPKPILEIRELSKEVGNELDKTMYLWKIEELNLNEQI